MKKAIRLLSILSAVILLLAACSGNNSEQITQTQETEQPDPSEAQQQILLIMNSMDEWKAADASDAGDYSYTVADLDGNGRLEIIAAVTRDTDLYTYGYIYEVSEDFASLVRCDTPCGHDSDLPEIIVQSVPAAYDAQSGSYDYLFTNDTQSGSSELYQSIMAVRFQNGVLSCTVLANSYTNRIDEGQEEHEYAVVSGDTFMQVSALEYNAVISNYQEELQGFTANFEWFTFASDVTQETLSSSLSTFQSE